MNKWWTGCGHDVGRGRQVGRKVDKKQLMYRPFDSFVRKAVKQENQQRNISLSELFFRSREGWEWDVMMR